MRQGDCQGPLALCNAKAKAKGISCNICYFFKLYVHKLNLSTKCFAHSMLHLAVIISDILAFDSRACSTGRSCDIVSIPTIDYGMSLALPVTKSKSRNSKMMALISPFPCHGIGVNISRKRQPMDNINVNNYYGKWEFKE